MNAPRKREYSCISKNYLAQLKEVLSIPTIHWKIISKNKISQEFFLRGGEGSMFFSIDVVVAHQYSRVHPMTIEEFLYA